MRIAVFGQDPGGHTGLAWGVFDLDLPDIATVMRARTLDGQDEVTGDEREQIRLICKRWHGFIRRAVLLARVEPARVYYVSEDFVLRPGAHAGGKEGTSPERIMWGVEGYRMGQADYWNARKRGQARKLVMPEIILQQPEQAKTFARKDRLKDWGCWIVGKEHARSAWQHVALFVQGYLSAHQNNLARAKSY